MNIKSTAILIVLIAFTATINAKSICKNVLEINGDYYEKEVLKSNLEKPYQFAIDKEEQLLFFSYNAGNDDEDTFHSAVIDLKSKSFSKITGVKDGFAAVVDNGTVYLGGSNGIYIYDKESKTAIRTDITDANIWVLFHSDHLYFIDYPAMKLHEYVDREVKVVKEFENNKIKQFAIDNNGTKFFENNTGIYKLENNYDAVLLTESIEIRGMAINNYGRAYFCGEGGVYSEEDGVLKIHARMNDVYAIAFDKYDNLVYATEDEIVMLKPSKKKCDVIIQGKGFQ